jgi:hypothetical protein
MTFAKSVPVGKSKEKFCVQKTLTSCVNCSAVTRAQAVAIASRTSLAQRGRSYRDADRADGSWRLTGVTFGPVEGRALLVIRRVFVTAETECGGCTTAVECSRCANSCDTSDTRNQFCPTPDLRIDTVLVPRRADRSALCRPGRRGEGEPSREKSGDGLASARRANRPCVEHPNLPTLCAATEGDRTQTESRRAG